MSPRRKKGPLEKGRQLYLQGRYQESLGQYLEAVVQDPGDAQAHCGLAEVLEALGRLGEALVSFEQALRLDPGPRAFARPTESCYNSAAGRLAQWESASFTRKRSLVQNQCRPQRCPS